MKCRAATFIAAAMLSGCSDKTSSPVSNYDEFAADVQNESGNAGDAVPAQQSARPAHNYDFVEGDLYGYLGAVSEEDQKKGVAAPSVVRFRYTGFWKGAHHLQNVNDNGAVTGTNECGVPCVAIKEVDRDGSVRRIGFSTGSIIGAAFEDAMGGRLRRSPQPGTVKDGYKFKGGDPGNPANWQLIEQSPVEVPSPAIPATDGGADNGIVD